MAKYKKRQFVSVSDLANYAANPSGFYDYKTKKNIHAIKRGLLAHGDNYKSFKGAPALALLIFIIAVLTLFYVIKYT